MTKKVLVLLDSLKAPNCGLGQVAKNMGTRLGEDNSLEFQFNLLLPKKWVGAFGKAVKYHSINKIWKENLYFFLPKFDLWHITHQTGRLLAPSKAISILTIHDLNFLWETGETNVDKRLNKIRKQIKNAKYLTYISEFTRNTVELNIPEAKNKPNRVIYNGVVADLTPVSEKPLFLPEGEFLFTIGQIREKKNFHVLIEMLKYIENVNLIISGEKNGEYASLIVELINKNNLQDRVVLSGAVSEQEKAYLYQNCKAFVFPSKYEGFGLPVIEAMLNGKPVFCSNMTSLPEIGGKHAFYWENFESEYMSSLYTEKMRIFEAEKEMRIAEMINYAKQFSWDQNFNEYKKLYKELLS